MMDVNDEHKVSGDRTKSPETKCQAPSGSSGEASPITFNLFRQFQDHYELTITEKTFVTLCGYLYYILRHGWHVAETQLDHFITYYETFSAWMPFWEFQQIQAAQVRIPSYHQWFMAEKRKPIYRSEEEAEGYILLNEERLRAIGRENPLMFIRAQVALDSIGTARHRDDLERRLMEQLM